MITFPLQTKSQPDLDTPLSPPLITPQATNCHIAKILPLHKKQRDPSIFLIDDDPFNTDCLKRILSKLCTNSPNITCFSSAELALQSLFHPGQDLVSNTKVDLIFTDYNLMKDHLNGLEFIKIVYEKMGIQNAPSIALVSGEYNIGLKIPSEFRSLVSIFSKPVDVKRLEEYLSEIEFVV